MLLVRSAGLAWVPSLSKTLALPPSQVDIWKVYLSRCPATLADTFLSTKEKKRAAAIANPKNRVLFQASRAALRDILSRYVPVESPSAISINTETNGKPLITGPGSEFHFNISHTNEISLIAVGRCAVGIDVESKKRRIRNIKQLLETKMAAVEQAYIRRKAKTLSAKTIFNADEAVRQEFVRMWVRKEAHAKCLGLGIAKGFRTFYIVEDSDGFHAQNIGEPLSSTIGHHPITDIDVDETYIAALSTMSEKPLHITRRLYQ